MDQAHQPANHKASYFRNRYISDHEGKFQGVTKWKRVMQKHGEDKGLPLLIKCATKHFFLYKLKNIEGGEMGKKIISLNIFFSQICFKLEKKNYL